MNPWKNEKKRCMASRETRKLLYDVQQPGRLVLSFTHGKALEDYGNDRMIQSAVERQLEIVGEVSVLLEKQK